MILDEKRNHRPRWRSHLLEDHVGGCDREEQPSGWEQSGHSNPGPLLPSRITLLKGRP